MGSVTTVRVTTRTARPSLETIEVARQPWLGLRTSTCFSYDLGTSSSNKGSIVGNIRFASIRQSWSFRMQRGSEWLTSSMKRMN